MNRNLRRLTGALVLAAGLAGCMGPHSRPCDAGHSPDELPLAERGSVEANLHTLPPVPADPTSPEHLAAPPYRALTAGQCQCLAVAAAVPAGLQDEEAELAVARSRHKWVREHGAALRRDVLGYTSLELRNRAAGTALELYFHIAEAEGKIDLLGQALTTLDQAVRETKRMTDQKLKPPVALDVWTRQSLTMQGDRWQADMTITQLNGELRRLLGFSDAGDGWRVWNPDTYDVIDTPIDVEAAVAQGLARRAELLLLRRVLQELDADNLTAARDLLQTIHPLLGASHPAVSILTKVLAILHLHHGDRGELEVRRRQLAEYLHERELAVADEVRQAAAGVKYHYTLAGLALEREKSWEAKEKEVRSRQGQGLTSFAEVASTTLETLKARADVIQEVMAWYIAHAKLRQAQGLLVAECAAANDACYPQAAARGKWRLR
jgi:hypothetical protein